MLVERKDHGGGSMKNKLRKPTLKSNNSIAAIYGMSESEILWDCICHWYTNYKRMDKLEIGFKSCSLCKAHYLPDLNTPICSLTCPLRNRMGCNCYNHPIYKRVVGCRKFDQQKHRYVFNLEGVDSIKEMLEYLIIMFVEEYGEPVQFDGYEYHLE